MYFDEKTPFPHMRTRLVQRLDPPRDMSSTKYSGFGDNPFSFGGGYKNGGLSDEVMIHIRYIFSFDYMGAAEYEFGAVPKALEAMAKAASEKRLKFMTLTLKKKPVWAICPDTFSGSHGPVDGLKYAEEVIKTCAKGYRYEDFKMGSNFKEALEGTRKTQGWLEIDHGFMFFIDNDMFLKSLALFGLNV